MRGLSFAILFVVGASFSTVEKEIDLEYTFKVGDRYEWLQTTSQTVKQTIPGMGDVAVDVKMEGTFDLKVLDLTATGASIEIQYVRLKVQSKSPLADVNFDSDGDATNTQNKIVKSMVGKPFSFTMTKRGVIEKVEGSENLLSGLSELGLDEAAQARARQMLNETVGESSVKASLGTGFLSYPEKKVKAGDHWKQTAVLPFSLPLSISNDWNLKGVEGLWPPLKLMENSRQPIKKKLLRYQMGSNQKLIWAVARSCPERLT